jgi:hypothetical protein
MARATLNYKVTDEGRDKDKVFVLTELPASKAESWAMRAILALMAGGVELKWEVAEPLLAEMWQCVQIMPDPSKTHIIRNLIEEDIEEIATRVKLRAEVWKLHTGFLKAVAPSISGGSPAAASKKGSRNT